MNINEVLTFLAQVLFVILTSIAIFAYLRDRNPRRRDFALFCSALGVPLGISLLKNLFVIRTPVLDLFAAFVLFSQPYFLFRLLQYYRPKPRWITVLILAGMVACWFILLRFFASNPRTAQILIFGYMIVVEAYCTWEYSRGMSESSGTLRQRLFLITISAGLFTVAMVGNNVVNAILSERQPTISAVAWAITALSALLYYIAFIPPRWVRHAWHYDELRAFLSQKNVATSTSSARDDNFAQLCSAATQAVNANLGAVIERTGDSTPWNALCSTNSQAMPAFVAAADPLITQVWQQHKSLAVYAPDLTDRELRGNLQQVGAQTWLLAPIQTSEYLRGVLLVTLRDRALFIDDDLMLLELFAQQSAMVQENNRLIDRLRDYSEQLEHKVEERTQELQQSEAALLELNATLEQRIIERTAELQQSSTELERSNQELDQFAYVASHDLKAPLRAISHLTDWIEQDAGEVLPEVARGHLDKLRLRVNRMETLLNDLLAYSRVGRQRHQHETIDMAELIANVSEMVAPPTGFSIKVDGELPVMEAERAPLETVFRNLIGNAIKHHDRVHDGNVRICARMVDDFVEFTVAGDGPGIAPEFHQRIFEIFQTLLPRDQVEGSGIGLAIVKKSVESRGGTIAVDSAPGDGTIIRFTWPQNNEQPTAEVTEVTEVTLA